MRHLRALAFGFAALLSACSQTPASGTGGSYVALGSSFAAGTGMGGIKPGTPERCQRSPLNYATLLARHSHLTLIDASCGGAMTAHVLGPWDELAAQVASITPDTRLVTITIGGNDVGYIRNLIADSCESAAPSCPSRLDPTKGDWTAMERGLRQIVTAVRTQAPQARVVFVDYITLLPATGNCAALKLSGEELRQSRIVANRLAATTAYVAHELDAELLPASALSKDHTACDPVPWSAGAPGTAPGAPWHPNAAGHAAIAAALEQLLATPR